jgi:fucose permease
MESMVVLVALLGSFGLGMCFSLLGSVSIKLMPRLNIDKGKFGTLISAFMFTCLVASLIVGVSLDKIGYKPVAIFGFVATAICIFLIARGKTFSNVLISCLLLGFGAMALNVTANTLLPIVLFGGKNPAAASNLGNTFFGLGLFLTPLIISSLFKKTTYENAVSAMGIIILIPAILAIISSYPQSNAGFVFADAARLLAEPTVWVSAILLFCYIGLESSLTNWLPAFGKEVIAGAIPDVNVNKADSSAQRLLMMFAIGMMAGRLGASQISGITTYGSWFIAGAALIITIIIVLMIGTKSILLSRVLAVLAGLAFAPCFPTIAGVTFSKFNPEVYGSLFGIIFAIGLFGGVIIPKAIGNLAKGSSVQKSLKLLLPACVILVILALVLGKM